MQVYHSISGSVAEDLFIDLFSETFGAEKARYLYSQYHFFDIYQNSMVYLGWDVYRWAVRQMQIQPESVKDELRIFLGNHPQFKEIEDYLPTQRGKALGGANLEL